MMLQTFILSLNLRISNIMLMLFGVYKTEQKIDVPTKSSENLPPYKGPYLHQR